MEIISLKEETISGRVPKQNDVTRSGEGFLITKISPAVKNENRVNIYINSEYDFSLDIAQVVDFKLKEGKRLSSEEREKLRRASEFGKLYQRTLEWVLMRPRSIKETRDHLREKRYKRETENRQAKRNLEKIKSESKEERLKRKEAEKKYGNHLKTKELPVFSDEDLEKVIAKLIERGYLDDKKFVNFYIENRFVKKGISKKRLILELKNKGVQQEIIEEAFVDNPRDEQEEIKKIIAKKRKKYDDEKLLAYLVRQGFDYQTSKNLINESDDSID